MRFVTRDLCPACLFLEKKKKTKLAAELLGTPPDGRGVIPVTDIWVVSTRGQKIQGRERASSRPSEYSWHICLLGKNNRRIQVARLI